MKSIIHRSATRGHANFGWLDTHHTFSFANYYDPERMHFGALRVLNDDIVAPGMGFGTHPHDNMEIISIPLKGALEHKDSMGNVHVIRQHDIQVMSAGTGIYHSEKNASGREEVNFLQIWVFPLKANITPRYDQKTFDPADRQDAWQRIVSPDEEGVPHINQNAWFSMGRFSEGKSTSYELHSQENGVYIFLLSGKISVEGNEMETRDGIGIWESDRIGLTALRDSEVLLMEVPMKF